MENKKLYYVVEKQTTDVGDDIFELNGWKLINVYIMIDNQPKIFCEIEGENSLSTENEIQVFLDNNNFDDEFDFVQL